MSENRGAKAARAMFVYAGVMIATGLVAFALAPEGAKAVTALAVPAACGAAMIVCGFMSRAIDRKYALGMIGIHLGLVLPLVFVGVIGWRAAKTGAAVAVHHDTETKWQATGQADAAARAAFFEAAGAPDHDKSYLRNTLWFLTAASAVAFGAILVNRPPKIERA